MFARPIHSLWRSIDGSALVEATALMPVLIVLFFGVFEFSWYFFNQQLTEIGVRDAARYLARGPYLSAASFIGEGTNPCDSTTNKDAARSLAVKGTTDGSGSARVKGWTTTDVGINCTPISNTGSPPPYVGPSTIYLVTVSTSFADPTLGYFGLLGLGVPNLSASHTERSFGSS